MKKEDIKQAIKKVKESSPKRNFKQRIDLIITLRGIDMKKSDQLVNNFVNLHHPTGKKVSVCALVGNELSDQAKEVCDEVITDSEFEKYQKSKKEAKKLANKHDFFIAQATIMPKIATAFGRVFGPRGKMPNPKAGCVVPPNANLKPLYDKLQKTVQIQTKNQPVIQVGVGLEEQNDDEVVDNVLTLYDALIHQLHNGEHNIQKAMVKLTMGPSFVIGGKEEDKKPEVKKETKKEEKPAEEKKEEAPKAEEKEKSQKSQSDLKSPEEAK